MFQLLLVTGMNRTLGISDKWFSVGDSLVVSVLAQVCFHNSHISLNLCGHFYLRFDVQDNSFGRALEPHRKCFQVVHV